MAASPALYITECFAITLHGSTIPPKQILEEVTLKGLGPDAGTSATNEFFELVQHPKLDSTSAGGLPTTFVLCAQANPPVAEDTRTSVF
jgi:hypothetical protein